MVEAKANTYQLAITKPEAKIAEVDFDKLSTRFPHGFYSAVKELFNETLDTDTPVEVDRRKMPPTIRILDALISLKEEGAPEASIDEIVKRVKERAGVKHWWQDSMGPASTYDALHYLTGSDLIIPRYHLDYTSHDSAGYPVKKLLYRLAPIKTPEESQE